MKFTLLIPVKPYLRKYILFNNEWMEPVPVSRTTYPSVLLFNLLDRNITYNIDEGERTAEIRFCLDERYAQYRGIALTPNNVVLFNNVLDELFKQELYCKYDMIELEKVKVKEKQKRNKHARANLIIKDAIVSVAQKYALNEDDFTYENFRKILYRYRQNKAKKMRKNFARFVPN